MAEGHEWLAGREPHVSAQCPDCHLHELIPLALERTKRGRWRPLRKPSLQGPLVHLDACPVCYGAWFDRGELAAVGEKPPSSRPTSDPEALFQTTGVHSDRCCPRGHGPMVLHKLNTDAISTPVERCMTCEGLWLDGHERRKLARATTRDGQRSPAQRWTSRGLIWALQLVTQLPVELENPYRRTPWLVYLLLTAFVTVFFAELAGQIPIEELGLRAAAFSTATGYTLVTHALLHSSWAHLLGNAYFLHTFGDNVEHLYGRLRFALLFVGASVIGGALHTVLAADPERLLVGASGGISGILAAYFLSYSRRRIVWFVSVPAWAYLGAWALFNVAMALLATDHSVAWYAHLGGFAVGLVMTPLVHRARRREVARAVQVPAGR